MKHQKGGKGLDSEEYVFGYSKFYILLLFLWFLLFLYGGLVGVFGDFSLAGGSGYTRKEMLAYSIRAHMFMRVIYVFLCFVFAGLFGLGCLLFLKERRPHLVLNPSGIIISNLMPPGWGPIPWSEVKGYKLTPSLVLGSFGRKSGVLLDVSDHRRYIRSWIGLKPQPNILLVLSTVKLDEITSLLDHFIEESQSGMKDNGGEL